MNIAKEYMSVIWSQNLVILYSDAKSIQSFSLISSQLILLIVRNLLEI